MNTEKIDMHAQSWIRGVGDSYYTHDPSNLSSTESATIVILSNITSTPDKIPHEKPFEIPYDASQEMAMGKSATHSMWYKRSAARRYRQGADVKIEMEQVF
jgi:hypothetical protein